MHMEPGPQHQPLLHVGVFMSTVVINNEMSIQGVGYIPFNMLKKGDKLLAAVAALALRQHFPGGAI